jgi:exodeoxyribonuclease VII small subunit
MAKKKKDESADEQGQPSFEQALEQLQAVVRELESGQLTLEQSLVRYEQGVANLRRCYSTLQSAEQRIRMLVELDESGRAVTRNFAHEASHSTPVDEEDEDEWDS